MYPVPNGRPEWYRWRWQQRQRRRRRKLGRSPAVRVGVRRVPVAGMPAREPQLRPHVLQDLPRQHATPEQEAVSHMQGGVPQQVSEANDKNKRRMLR